MPRSAARELAESVPLVLHVGVYPCARKTHVAHAFLTRARAPPAVRRRYDRTKNVVAYSRSSHYSDRAANANLKNRSKSLRQPWALSAERRRCGLRVWRLPSRNLKASVTDADLHFTIYHQFASHRPRVYRRPDADGIRAHLVRAART